jgi:hyperosmotically inducible periplasmic protein
MQGKHSLWGIKGLPVLGACTILLTAMVGCADRNNNNQPDDVATAGEVNRAADKAGDAAANAADAAADAAGSAANSVAGAAKNLDDAAVITPKINAAYAANPSLSALKINLDTTDQNVTLSGTVKNAAQKNLAGTIAKKNAPGYKIVNNLKVAGGASPNMNR